MAAAAGVGLSSFVSGGEHSNKKLKPKKWNTTRTTTTTTTTRKSSSTSVSAAWGPELDVLRDQLVLGVGVGLPCTVMECGDIIYRSTLPRSEGLIVTAPGVALALAAVSYLWATPGVAPGFWDMFVLAFVERIFRPTFRKDDLIMGKKLGEGAFGVVYKVSSAKSKAKVQDELVLKKATEYGAVEIWMNERVRRACASSCADFVYGFLEGTAKGKGGSEYWLIWRFEGEDTLADLMLSKEFPYNEAMRKDTLERTREPNLDLKGYLLNAYIHPIFKESEDDDSISLLGQEEVGSVLVPTKRQSRRNTPVPSKYNGSSSPSLPDTLPDHKL